LQADEQRRSLHLLDDEQDNLRTALEWGLTDPTCTQTMLDAWAAMYAWWDARGLGREASARFADLARVSEAWGPVEARARVLVMAGLIAFNKLGDGVLARARLEEAVAIRKNLHDHRLTGNALFNLSAVLEHDDEVRAVLEEALALRDKHKLPGGWGVLGNLGLIDYRQGKWDEAETRLQEVLHVFRKQGRLDWVAETLSHLGNVARGKGDFAMASARFEEARTVAEEIEYRPALLNVLNGYARLHWAQTVLPDTPEPEARQHALTAARLFGAHHGLTRRMGNTLGNRDKAEDDPRLATLQTLLGWETYKEVYEDGERMEWNAALQLREP
jgi:tetratricopeptide (TPR) repeat protein